MKFMLKSCLFIKENVKFLVELNEKLVVLLLFEILDVKFVSEIFRFYTLQLTVGFCGNLNEMCGFLF